MPPLKREVAPAVVLAEEGQLLDLELDDLERRELQALGEPQVGTVAWLAEVPADVAQDHVHAQVGPGRLGRAPRAAIGPSLVLADRDPEVDERADVVPPALPLRVLDVPEQDTDPRRHEGEPGADDGEHWQRVRGAARRPAAASRR